MCAVFSVKKELECKKITKMTKVVHVLLFVYIQLGCGGSQ